MANLPVPTGKIIYFEGNPEIKFKDKLGFFYCKVTAPLPSQQLTHPIIQRHAKVNNVVSTISSLGTFNAMLYSEEIKNAIKYGYKFEVINGIVFTASDNIFMEYILSLYELRTTYDKAHPMNYIAKLLMNSLYGRFGMNDCFGISEFYNNEDFITLINKPNNSKQIENILDIVNYGNTHKKVKYQFDDTHNKLNSIGEDHNTNIATARAGASITAMARVYMSRFKNRDDINLYYTDTDSIFVNKDINQMTSFSNIFGNIIGNKLGQLKLECIVNKAIFLGPKVYFLETDNGNIVRVKGLSSKTVNNIPIDYFFKLLGKDVNLQLFQDKWYKLSNEATIKIIEQTYDLKHNSNKRELIYNNDDIMPMLINTKPYIIND